MSGKIPVKSYTRRAPEKKPDPFAPLNDAKRRRFASKWGVELVSANDDRLAAPIPDPVPGPVPMPIEQHKSLLRTLAELVRGI
ncbi:MULTISPECIES: hypothetical protein [unclassified Rhizobium]|uniref:hypothetical protein n=1 Tax=unclassified Rhizobium TaxID=2613769 RepID=UPI001AE25B61|nr:MULTISPECIES: hypothetical protein [unclassified Rhizobium]MBP2462085.1 hypothetical protein [Rhizobium sp. PvP014]MBP2529481.1 hypothetical protein [Rhizobium sp. PvP099]